MSLRSKILGTYSRHSWRRASYLYSLYERDKFLETQSNYLDIGAGTGQTSVVFGQGFNKIILLDLQITPESRALMDSYPNANWIVGDAHNLPFKDNSFDLVTMFSVVEHLQYADKAVCEASRTIKPGGQLVIQAPNSWFVLDLHTGLPNPFLFCPGFLRPIIISKLGYPQWVDDVHKAPSKKRLSSWLNGMRLVNRQNVIYPDVLIPNPLRGIYKIIRKTRLLDLIPLGHLYTYTKLPQ